MKDRIRIIRKMKDLTQTELANELGVSFARVKNLENGRVQELTNDEIKHFIRIGINPVWLLTGEGEIQSTVSNAELMDIIIVEVEETLSQLDLKLEPHQKSKTILTFYNLYENELKTKPLESTLTELEHIKKAIKASLLLKKI